MFEFAKSNPATTLPVPAKSTVDTVAAAINQQSGIQNLSNGVVYDIYTIPTSLIYTVTSTNAGVAKTVYAFNNDVLNAAVTTNDSAANSIVNTYGDGFLGRIYNQYLKTANGGRGIKMLGFTINATNFTSGVGAPSALITLALNLISANGQGSIIPIPFDLSEALRNTQYVSGMLTVKKEFYFNALSQLQMYLPINTSLTFTMFTEASGFAG